MAKNSQVNIGIKFKSDSKEVENSLSKLKKSLQDLQKIKPGDFNGTKKELNEAKNTAKQVEIAMEKAFNPVLNSTNINTFKASLKDAGLTVEKIKSDFAQFGVQGEVAFSRMTSSLLTTNLKLKQTNSLIDSMGKTMVNTVKWGIASSIMNSFTQSVQGAFQYVQSLEKSLTNIRIVTGDSTEKMAQFAEQANRSAQALGRSTLDYSKASLTFYQQGLNNEDVQARTEATLKAQNITGAGSQMADYLTSVWNGYRVANEEAELYVDKLAAVADSSASDMSQLAIAMSKVASTANTMGVDVDQLNAQIATVVATTRQAPESVGTAFKTIYTRMNDIKAGSDEAEISLGRYSGKMAELGFNVLDATGHLRDTGQVMEEIGGRWQDLTREQQVYLAQTMGGQRQVNQLMALFDNWTTYSELLNTSLESEGTLAEKNSRYMESLGAKMEQFGAAGERVKAALINTDSLKTVIEGLTGITNLVGNLFETMGSGNTVLLAFGSTLTQMFSGTIAKEINNIITNMQNVKYNAEQIKAELQTTKMLQEVGGADTAGGKIVLEKMAEIQQYYSVMDEASINNQKNLIAERAQIQNQIEILKQKRQQVEEIQKVMSGNDQPIDKDAWFDAKNNFIEVQAAIDNIKQSLKETQKLGSEDLFSHFYSQDMVKAQEAFTASFEKFIEDYSIFDTDNNKASEELARDFENFRQGTMSAGAFYRAYSQAVQIAKNKTKELEGTLRNGQSEFRNLNREAAIYDENIKSTANHFKQLFDVTNAVKMISAMGQIASVFTTIKNLGSIWQDEDISTSEKLLKTFTTIGFIVPTLVNSFGNISKVLGVSAALQERSLIIEKAITKEKERQEAIEKRKAKEQEIKNLKAEGKLTEEKAITLKKELNELEEAEDKAQEAALKALSEESKTKSGLSVAFDAAKTSVAGFVTQLAAIAPYIAAIGAVVAIGYTIYKVYNQASDAAKQAAENAKYAKEQYDKVKESFDNLTSSLKNYHEAEDALSKLVKGTEQWYDKVDQLNNKVLELLQNYPELAKYINMDENGVLSISKQGEKQIKNQQRQRVYTAAMTNAELQQKSYQADRTAKIVESGRDIYGFGGGQVLEKIIDEVAEKGIGILGDKDYLDQELKLTPEQIAATQENTTSILQLIKSLDAGQAKVDTLKDSLIKTSLNNETEYQQSKNKTAFSDMYSDAINKASSSLGDDFYKEQSAYDYQTASAKIYKALDYQKVIDAYEQASGQKVKRGFFGGYTVDGEKTTFETIKTYVEQSQANVDTAKILEETTARMEQAEKDFADASANTKDLIFNSGLIKGFDEVNAEKYSSSEIQKLKQYQSEIANYMGVSVEDVEKGLEALSKESVESTNDFIKNLQDASVKPVMAWLQNQIGEENLSKQMAEKIAQQIKDGYNKADTGKTIADFYSKLKGQSLKNASEIIQNFNYASGSLDNFISILEEAGVETEGLTEQIKKLYNTEKQIQEVSSKENRLDLDKVNSGSTTTSLAQKVSNGENLSDKELENMRAGLEDLKKVYPSLTKEIQILNNTQLAGTKSYQESLRKVKAALMASYEDMLKLEEISDYSQISNALKELIATTEDLQNARGRGLLTEEINSEILINLASKYQTCKNQIEKYTLALQSNDEQLKFIQGLNLETALRSAELAQKYGLEANSIEELSRHYQQLWSQQGSNRQSIRQNAELATEAAVAYMRLNQGIEALQKSYSDVETILNTLQEYDIEEILGDVDLSKKFDETRKSVAKLLNVSEDLVDSNFLEKYADQIKSLASGSGDAEEALADLQKGIAELSTEKLFDSLGESEQQELKSIKVDLDDDGFNETLLEDQNKLNEWLQNIPQGELSINDLNAINSLINLMQQAGWSAEEIEQYFRNQNIDLDIMDAEAALATLQNECGEAAQSMAEALGINTEVVTEENKNTDTIETPTQEGHWEAESASFSYPTFSAIPAGPLGGVNVVPTGFVQQPITGQKWVTKPDVEQSQANSSRTAVALSAVAGNKRGFGGGISHKNKSGGNKKSSGGGGKGGKGGGGGKAKEPNKAKGATNKADRYRNNTVKANKLANSMTKLQKQQERLTGKDSLKNLQKQLQILKKQNDTIRERIGLQRDEQKQLANNLKKSGATFDKDGTLNNYFKVHANIMKKYNDAVAKWNKMSADQQQKNKEYLNNAKTEMDNALKDLQRYDKLQQEIAKSIQQQIDNAQEQIDLKAKQFELKIKAELDLSEAKRDWNKFRRDLIDEVRDDDILGLNKYRFADISSYFNNIGTGSIQYLTDRLKELTGTPDGSGIFSADYLNETLKNMTVTDRQARLEQIKKVMDDLQGQMEDFKSLADDIKESIFDTIDAAQDAFDQQMDEYEYVGDLINHNMKVTELLFGDQAYDRMTKYYDRIEENNNKQLDFLTKEKDLWYSRMMEEQARMAQLNPNTNAYKQAEDRFKQYQKHWMDSVNDLNGKIEDALDNIMDKYANAISNIFLNFDLNLGGGRALDDISDEWDMLNDLADTYLDKINSAYEIEKLQNAFDDAIDDNEGNIAAQQSLNDLMEQQLAYLKDKEKLTQYDVDRANTLLQIEMKRLALEQSRNNKNRLRLRRDSQGNYTYQYTADTEAMNKAEQELADARNSLYNSDKAAYVDNLNAIQKSANDIKDKLEDIWNDENLSKEQKLQKSYELQKYYGQKINDLIAENASIRNNLMDSAFEELAKSYGISEDQFMAMSKEQQDAIFKDLIPQANSYAAQMVENIAGAGGMATFFQNLLGPLVQSYDNRVASISAIEEKSKTNFENIVNDTDILIGQAEQLLDNNDKLVGSQEEQLNLLQSQLNVVSQMLQKYEAYKSAISDAVESGYNILNDANAAIAGTTRAREDAATAAQMKQLENGMNAASSAWDIKDYTPYTPQWSGSDFAALFGSANIIPLTQQSGKVIQELGDVVPTLSNLNTNTLFSTIDNNIFNSINSILNNILETSQEYYATSLAKQDAIRQAVVANQTIHIDADFPNAKDVRNIIEAIEGLANAAAQRANTKGI